MKEREALVALVSIAISGTILNEPINTAFKTIPWDKIIYKENWEWVFLPKLSILNIILLVTVYYIAYLLLFQIKTVATNKLKIVRLFYWQRESHQCNLGGWHRNYIGL